MKKRPPYNANAAFRSAVRRAFARSPKVREVLQLNRREVPRYNKDGSRSKKNAVQIQCGVCKEWQGSTKVAVDHIEPVIRPDKSFIDWNDYMKRLDCDISNLQPICKPCHRFKTNEERFNRTLIKDLELITWLEKELDASPRNAYEVIRHSLKKFTPKTLGKYPKEFIERVKVLKGLIPKKSNAA